MRTVSDHNPSDGPGVRDWSWSRRRWVAEPAAHWIDEFRKEARQLLEEDFVQRAVWAVAAAVLAATPLYMLNDEQIQNAIESSA